MKFQPERLRGLEVDDELELAALEDRHVGWLLALENAPGIYARLAIGIGLASSIAHQPAGGSGLALAVNRRQRILGRQRDDPIPPGVEKGARADEQRAGSALHGCCKGRVEVAFAADIEHDELLADPLRCGLHVAS